MEERWEYRTIDDWTELYVRYVAKWLGFEDKVDLLIKMYNTIKHLESHGDAISSHHRYELNGILNEIVYDLTH